MRKTVTWFGVVVALGFATGPTLAADPAAFFPKDTDAIISLNVRQVLESTLVKKHAADLIKTAISGNKDIQEAIKLTGVDPTKDLDRLTVAVGIENPQSPKVTVLLEGKFDAKKLNETLEKIAKAEPKKVSMETFVNKTIFKFTGDGQPMPVYGAVIDSNVCVLSTEKAYVRSGYDAVSGTRKSELSKELAGLLAGADTKASAYLIASLKGKLEQIPLPDPAIKKALDPLQYLRLVIKAEKDIGIEIGVGTDTADNAKTILDLVKAGLDIVKTQAKVAAAQQEELQPVVDLLNTLKTFAKDKQVIIEGEVKGEAIEKILNKK